MISRDPPGAVNGSEAFSGEVESGLRRWGAELTLKQPSLHRDMA
jgi:hypothetical protein